MSSVAGKDESWRSLFPELYAEAYVDYAHSRVRYTVEPVPSDLVSRLHLVAVTGDGRVVVCRSAEGWRFLPGGTREPGESLDELARRELREEAGAVPYGAMHLFAAHVADSEAARPYRPHLPHPRAYWAYASCRVQVTGPPANPADGEQVVEVAQLPVGEAVAYLRRHDATHADILRHADALGLLRPPAT